MKTSETCSPFAALTSQEQKERWICWQCDQELRQHAGTEASKPLPELRLPHPPAPKETPSREAPLRPRQPIHHGQYDAVLRRMKDARRQAQPEQHWSP